MTLGMVHEWMHSGSATFALRLVCGISAVWLAAALAAMVLRQSSAALRHRVWSLSMGAALLLPALVAVLPEWRVGAISLPPVQETPAAQVSAAIAPAMPPLPERAAGQPLRIDPPPVETPRVAQSAAQEISSAPAAARADAPPRPAPPMNWTHWFWLAWLIPALWLILCQAAALLAARNLVRRSTPLDDCPAAECLSRLMGRLSICARPRLLENGELGSPMCLGWRRPAILLPADWRDWLPAQLEAVLTHELAHIARRDVLWQMLARLACSLYWFHPLAWVAVWRLRVERELACDDWVLRGGESSTRYARWLLEAATRLLGREPHAAERVGVAMAARTGFEKRIRAILDPHRRRFPVSRPMAVILTLAAAAILGAAGMLSPLATEKVGAGEAQAIAATQPAKKSPRLARISGRVEDEDGRAVGSVEVMIDGLRLRQYAARTDADGRFGLEVEPRRYQTVQASTPDRTRQAYRVFEDAIEAGQVTDLRLVLRPAREFAVTVNDAKGLPVAGAWVAVNSAHRVADEAVTDAEGRALLHLPPDTPPMYLIAGKPDVGLDYVLFWRKGEIHIDPYRLEPDHRDPVTLVLDGTKTVKVRVVDEEDRPLSGVRVYPWYVQRPRKGNYANTSGVAQFRVTTDEHGIAAFRMIPLDNTCTINFWPTREGYCAPKRCLWDPRTGQTEVTVQLLRQIPATGRVVDSTGRPVGGARVRVSGAPQRDDRIDGFHNETESAEDGTFQIKIDPDMRYLFVAAKDRMASPAHVQMIGREAPAAPIELVLAPAVRVHGRVVVGPERTPYPGAYVTLSQEDERPPLERRFSDGSFAHVMSSVPSVSESLSHKVRLA